ncbi:PilW family protein [Thermocrinis minervae]|uniref:Type IV pilus assembly protein PilW n=1 Tax=Thermocrinis minervae TaxID=381751 RepID=A0A1M6Q0S9_9AQUI|nr:type II secretion system protein [Thermocrinis minervae]SHK13855.1 type IV pilus assembly protein PilW [Thermocrinis minervae]
MKRGMTLVELLVIMVMMVILGAGVITAVRDLVRRSQPQITLAKQQQDVEAVVTMLTIDYSSAGFGVPVNQLLNAVQNIASLDTSRTPSCFLTATANLGVNSGCWGVVTVDNNGNPVFNVNSINSLVQNCPQNRNQYTGSCFDLLRNPVNNCLNCTNCVVFFGQVGQVCYSLGNSGDTRCAPGTRALRRVWTNQNQPVVDCVRSFGVRYMVRGPNGVQYVDQLPQNLSDLLGVRLCMILQVGERQSVQQPVPAYSPACQGVNILPVNNAEEYRWQVIERDIPLRNLQ